MDSPSELARVMKCVAEHLSEGGVFLFDVFDHQFFRKRRNVAWSVQVGTQVIDLYDFYDLRRRVAEGRVVIGAHIEGHRRVPIEAKDVCAAAKTAGLKVLDRFSTATYYLSFTPNRQFYVLQKST
jgi:hypothetical protein